ncbi:MAG TPA: ABC transporter permease [Oceanithermus profundus]|uniref:ABC transporter permease n=1 Tax=Oceanithermus profundus TaxID=187137 RepID=A0A7C4ZHC0_9DEIN|nr:ABC transporter permease [Oceanithermus profundus]
MRYLRLAGIFWAASAAARMEYRAAFAVSLVAAVVETAGKLFGVYLFYSNGYDLGGWRWQEALLVLGFAQLVDAFFILLFQPNLRRISEMVQDGTLDFVLLKPVDGQFWMSVQQVGVVGFPYLVTALALLLFAGSASGLPAGGWGLLGVAAVAAVLLGYAVAFLLATTSIWFVKIFNVVYFLSSMIWSAQYPVQAYARPFRLFMTFVLPVYFMTTAPAELALGRAQASWAWALFAVALGFFLLSRAFWRFALRYYSSASS